MREAMAEMGRRPAETELDAMMQTADKVCVCKCVCA